MILMVKQEPVNVNWQTLFCIIPYVWIWAFYRIEKLRLGIIIAIGTAAASISIGMLIPFPYGLIGNLIISISVPIYFIRKWSHEWNKKLENIGRK